MDSCYTKCCYQNKCYSLGTAQINIVGYHKVCFKHLEDLKSLNKLVCGYCKATCKVTLDFLPETEPQPTPTTQTCPYCKKNLFNSPKPYLRTCSHIHCDTCANTCTPNQNPYDTNSRLIQPCPNCGQRYTQHQMKCSHQGCLECASKENCKECNKNKLNNQKCKYCNRNLENSQTMYFRACNHVHCDNCAQLCLPKPNQYKSENTPNPLCPNCNERYEKKTLVCTHQGCTDCFGKNRCKICEKNPPTCPNCQNKGIPVELGCKHFGCHNCIDETDCRNCRNRQNTYFNPPVQVKQCENCSQYANPIRLQCGHVGCVFCSNRTECYVCELSEKCINCKDKNLNVNWNECVHKICVGCFNSNRKCKECFVACKICNKFYIKNDLLEGNSACRECVNKRTILEQCNKCGALAGQIYILTCGHRVCFRCHRHDYCVACHNEQLGICEFCRMRNVSTKLNCGHNTCEECSINGICFGCIVDRKDIVRVFFEDMCDTCSRRRPIRGILLCGHKVCYECVGPYLRFFDFRCHSCALKSNKWNCVMCGKNANWKNDGHYFFKACCEKYYCFICKRFGALHQC